jgi:hypothetical protein
MAKTKQTQEPEPAAAALAACERIRISVGRALGLSPSAQLTPEMLAEAVDRIRQAAGQVEGVALLARDLDAAAGA